jgi:hypothetical protein
VKLGFRRFLKGEIELEIVYLHTMTVATTSCAERIKPQDEQIQRSDNDKKFHLQEKEYSSLSTIVIIIRPIS